MRGYEYHNNILSIPAALLYEDWEVMSYDRYKYLCKPNVKKLIRSREGKGLNNEALLSFYDLPMEFQTLCIEKLGEPTEVVAVNLLEPYVLPDPNAASFFTRHRTPDGKELSPTKQRQRATACFILNAIENILQEKGLTHKMFGRKKTKLWENIADAVNKLPARWEHCLPTSAKHLKKRYEEYTAGNTHNFQIFIHKGEGNQNTAKIRGAVADFVLAQYCLPNKLTIPMVLAEYEKVRNQQTDEERWPTLTREAIYNWLYQPEQERIWTLARHGKTAYARKFQHTIERDKSDWFPNVYWAIDGTKLDWIYFEETASNKMAANLRIDVLFDVFSEKIIGYSLSESETHLDHFAAIKMAVQNAGCRPYLLTYDNQSGHKSTRMKELYNNLVAIDAGTHYPHRTSGKSNTPTQKNKTKTYSPAEQLFNRFQESVINRFWFSDGQSVKVRREDNRVNTEFIKENRDSLRTKEELTAAWTYAIKQWNESKHPHFEYSRTEAYVQEMPMRQDLSIIDVLQYMWLNETKPITYKREGITMEIKGKKYAYEVYDGDDIDTEFRRKNIGRKFVLRYDPDNMDVFVQLMHKQSDGELVFVANAEPKRKFVDIPVLMKEGEKERWHKDFKVRDEELERDLKAVKELQRRTGITPEKMIAEQELAIKMQNVATKMQNNKADTLTFEDDFLNRI